MGILFEWDPEKARRSLAKHGISFEVARDLFLDPFLLVVEDREIDGEFRYHALGHAGSGPILLLAVFADRSDDDREIIRIISAREADQYEQRAYADQFEKGN